MGTLETVPERCGATWVSEKRRGVRCSHGTWSCKLIKFILMSSYGYEVGWRFLALPDTHMCKHVLLQRLLCVICPLSVSSLRVCRAVLPHWLDTIDFWEILTHKQSSVTSYPSRCLWKLQWSPTMSWRLITTRQWCQLLIQHQHRPTKKSTRQNDCRGSEWLIIRTRSRFVGTVETKRSQKASRWWGLDEAKSCKSTRQRSHEPAYVTLRD